MLSRSGLSDEFGLSANRHETSREGASPSRSRDVSCGSTTLATQMGVNSKQNERFTGMSDQNDPEDTEGHKAGIPGFARDDEDTEGNMKGKPATDEDVEGHKAGIPHASDDDTEGHKAGIPHASDD